MPMDQLIGFCCCKIVHLQTQFFPLDQSWLVFFAFMTFTIKDLRVKPSSLELEGGTRWVPKWCVMGEVFHQKFPLLSLQTAITCWPTPTCWTCWWLRTWPWWLPCWSPAPSTQTTGAASPHRYALEFITWLIQVHPFSFRAPTWLYISLVCFRVTTSEPQTTNRSGSGSGWAASLFPWCTARSCWTCAVTPAGTWPSTHLTRTTAGPSTTSWCSPSPHGKQVRLKPTKEDKLPSWTAWLERE